MFGYHFAAHQESEILKQPNKHFYLEGRAAAERLQRFLALRRP